MLRFRTCEFGCKVTNIEIIEKPKFVDKGWEVIGRHALFDCESNSIDLGMANEESVEESVGLEVSQEYSNEVNGAVTVGHSIEFKASPPGGKHCLQLYNWPASRGGYGLQKQVFRPPLNMFISQI